MSGAIRIAIAGYGNLGRGVEAAVGKNPDMSLVGIFTRRSPQDVVPLQPGTPVFGIDALDGRDGDIDVLILCGGSKDDLPVQGPAFAARFNTVDSFDTHARIPEYFDAVDAQARAGGRTALIACGWDPGLFSINRVFGEALLPDGATYTFWGRGLSQGHSDAVRRVPGVAGGVQYTIPSEEAIARVRGGARPELSVRERHVRECYVVLAQDADAEQVRQAIVSMPHYFDQYDTTVHFISAEELARDHGAMPHGGFVIRSGNTSADQAQVIEYGLALGSNPQFTASVLVAYARAVHRMGLAGQAGAKTVFDVPPGWLSPKSAAELRRELL
ncbi:diaminopimelate dehydrogenase [Pseudoxanthomonas broegbernensis]|uniref:Meso-diaminopimelate D-dehydrogenase n=1 Tax=Pseudoxanthomonas broegbernensis TaxID=83619 RepID=A0A7V8GKC7_9GAMM|nr:diaminopimelate dehydrogenase [Pseudoxanthomonas broegbernensis]KAF1685011.1 diaminopimelate dehydrogenase [Pseudoxanthomonas broegbernensis]MBB6066326.1 diaminopimelate dehydrogenase [Pseudoxanthomonas broegbernensis]